MANYLNGIRLQGIMVVVFIICDWIFVLKNTTTKIPYRRVSWTEWAIASVHSSNSRLLSRLKANQLSVRAFPCGISAISYAFAFDKYHLCCANVVFNLFSKLSFL